MKTASFLLALVVVLGFVREAGAEHRQSSLHDFTIEFEEYSFGFKDFDTVASFLDHSDLKSTSIFLGPLGTFKVPFTATQGLVGFCFILAMLIFLPVVLTVRWKKKWAHA